MGFWDLFKSESPAPEASKKPEKEKRREKKWKDPNEQEKYVCEAGKVQCLYCKPQAGGFNVTSNTVYLQDRYYVTEGDNNGKVNLNFEGVCTHPTQKSPPCKSVIATTKWKNCADTYVNDFRPLLVKSTIPCMISQQDIKIVHSGQKAVLNEVTPISFVLVTSVKGETEVYPNEKITYQVTSYNKPAKTTDKARVRWTVEVDGKRENLLVQGEKVEIKMKEKWAGKEIIVMPYLNTPVKSVSQKTKVKLEAVIVFVNGYWNSGESSKYADPTYKILKKLIAENIIGTEKEKKYWGYGVPDKAKEYFKKKYQEWTTKEIEKFDYIYIDGSNAWHSSGGTRWKKGWEEADGLMEKLSGKKVINDEKEQMKRIFFVSHSMGGAHAEGIISFWRYKKLEIEQALHFSAADNNDFSVCVPNHTYQINLLPDIVLAYKNNDDSQIIFLENIWEKIKEKIKKSQKKDLTNLYQIRGMLTDHYIVYYRDSIMNHADTKFDDVWNIVPFLK